MIIAEMVIKKYSNDAEPGSRTAAASCPGCCCLYSLAGFLCENMVGFRLVRNSNSALWGCSTQPTPGVRVKSDKERREIDPEAKKTTKHTKKMKDTKRP